MILLVAGNNLFGQNKAARTTSPVFNSANGPVLLFGTGSLDDHAADGMGTRYQISRTDLATHNTKQLNLTGAAKNFSSFKKLAGEDIVRQLEQQLKITGDVALWAYIQQHRDFSAYGFLALSIPFRTALGAAYTDEEVKDQKGKTFLYEVTETNSRQAVSHFQTSVTIGQTPDFDAPHVIQSRASDSTVVISWWGRRKQDIPYLALVYRQTGGSGGFRQLHSKILSARKGDSVYYLFTEKVSGNSAYRYFIRPADLLENVGSRNSDTVNVVAVDYRKLPVITGLKARDTSNAIYLSWKPLPSNPMLTGIEIQRSRDSRGNYVVIDTIPAASAAYRDSRLLPHVAYYYRLAVLHAGNAKTRKYYTAVSAANQKTSHIPDAPYGIRVHQVKNAVLVNWQPVADPDIYAYYVYRSTSVNAPMQVISPALRDTSFADTATNLSRDLAYVYAVTAVTNASKESAFSEKISSRLASGRERPRTPGGIRVLETNGALSLQWEDVMKNDPSVLGYILYKHKVSDRPLQYASTRSASEEAARLNLTLAFAGIIRVPYFEDSLSRTGDRFEYLVSAVDRFGAESGLSPTAAAPRTSIRHAMPPDQVFVRAVPEGVAIQWEQGDLAGIQSFAIYRRTIDEKSAKRIATVKMPATSYTDRQPLPGKLNIYTVTSLSVVGESAASLEKSIRR